MIQHIKEAARRCDSYGFKYGVIAHWRVTTLGLRLLVESASERCEKHVAWVELESARHPGYLLQQAEEQALRGVLT